MNTKWPDECTGEGCMAANCAWPECEIDFDIQRILAMTPEECRLAGIIEFGSEEAWHAAMTDIRERMLRVVDTVIEARETVLGIARESTKRGEANTPTQGGGK